MENYLKKNHEKRIKITLSLDPELGRKITQGNYSPSRLISSLLQDFFLKNKIVPPKPKYPKKMEYHDGNGGTIEKVINTEVEEQEAIKKGYKES